LPIGLFFLDGSITFSCFFTVSMSNHFFSERLFLSIPLFFSGRGHLSCYRYAVFQPPFLVGRATSSPVYPPQIPAVHVLPKIPYPPLHGVIPLYGREFLVAPLPSFAEPILLLEALALTGNFFMMVASLVFLWIFPSLLLVFFFSPPVLFSNGPPPF